MNTHFFRFAFCNPQSAIFNFFLVCLSTTLFASCVSRQSAIQHFHPTKQQQGSLQWQMSNGERLNAFVTFFENANGQVGLSIGKEGPQPLLQLAIDQEQITSSGPLAGGSWTGSRLMMPRKLYAWVCLLDAYKAAIPLQPGKHQLDTQAYTAEITKYRSTIRSLTVCSKNNDIFFVRL